MKRLLFTVALASFLWTVPATAQRAIEDEPGYVDLAMLESLIDEETTLEVNVRGALLRMVAEAARIEDEDLAEMLLKLRAIHVRGYSLDRIPDSAGERIAAVTRALQERGWERVVRVREDGEFVEMLVAANEDRVEGMVVFVMDEGENSTVFVNIVGSIDPEDIARIGRRFRIRVLEDL